MPSHGWLCITQHCQLSGTIGNSLFQPLVHRRVYETRRAAHDLFGLVSAFRGYLIGRFGSILPKMPSPGTDNAEPLGAIITSELTNLTKVVEALQGLRALIAEDCVKFLMINAPPTNLTDLAFRAKKWSNWLNWPVQIHKVRVVGRALSCSP